MKRFFDMLYPRSCIGCGTSAPETFRYICWDCWSGAMRVEPPFCDLCGDPVAGSVDHDFICYACSAEKPAFDGARSAARYDGVVGEALRQLKYEKALWLATDMAELLHTCMLAEYPEKTFDLVVPVPLFRVRRRERGYNQSAVLARELGKRMPCRTVPNLLRRIRPTATQTNLTAPQRLSNVQGAFRSGPRRRLAGQRILLVDDVMTTGATVNVCAKALKKGGALSVHVLTVARG
ncbi:MAG: ComF family protein [Pontiella sp.]|nr:ComF family protein [Pontiella sp.]